MKNKCYTPLIKYNKRNTKNKKKLAENKMTKNQKKIYKRRSVVEHSFAWLKSRPIINQNYQKNYIILQWFIFICVRFNQFQKNIIFKIKNELQQRVFKRRRFILGKKDHLFKLNLIMKIYLFLR